LSGLDGLFVEEVQFRLRVREVLRLPAFKGPAFRGALGITLRRAVCIRPRGSCGDCDELNCPYRLFFEPTDQRGLPIPSPFVLRPPRDLREEMLPGEEMILGMGLFGPAVRYLPLLVMVLDECGRRGIGRGRGRFHLEEAATPDGVVYSAGRLMYHPRGRPLRHYWEQPVPDDGRIRLEFLTPVLIRSKGRPVDPGSFEAFYAAVCRRVKLLARFYGAERIKESPPLREKAGSVLTELRELWPTVVRRRSLTQKRVVRYPGFVGRVGYSGLCEELQRWLRLGEAVAVGKGCTFGLGWYRVVRPS